MYFFKRLYALNIIYDIVSNISDDVRKIILIIVSANKKILQIFKLIVSIESLL